MTPDQFAQDWERHLRAVMQACRAEVDKALAAMTDDSQPDVQPGPPWGPVFAEQAREWWSAEQPDVVWAGQAGYVWEAPTPIDEVYKPTPEQAKEAEQDRLWRLVVGTARGG